MYSSPGYLVGRYDPTPPQYRLLRLRAHSVPIWEFLSHLPLLPAYRRPSNLPKPFTTYPHHLGPRTNYYWYGC